MPDLKLFQFNENSDEVLSGAVHIKQELQSLTNGTDSLDSDIDEGKLDDKLIYIYTSGTTGLPKASIIRNSR